MPELSELLDAAMGRVEPTFDFDDVRVRAAKRRRRRYAARAVIAVLVPTLALGVILMLESDRNDRSIATSGRGTPALAEGAPCPVTKSAGLETADERLSFIDFSDDGVAIADQLRDGGYHLHLAWLTYAVGRFEVHVERLDGPGHATVYDPLSSAATPPVGMRPTSVVFSRLGCWRITGMLAQERLVLVFDIVPSEGIVDFVEAGACPITTSADADRGYGTAALRVNAPVSGIYAAPGDPDNGYSLKLPWFREEKGHLTIRAKRLDGPGEATIEISQRSYPPTGFLPTGVLVSDVGCWRITGKLGDQRVSVVLRVNDAGSGPVG